MIQKLQKYHVLYPLNFLTICYTLKTLILNHVFMLNNKNVYTVYI